jgi:uncharacterized surface protein with fasciclin (FAS1) repeats
VSTELPPVDDLRHLADRLRANDIAWVRSRWSAGWFEWLRGHLPEGEYDRIGSRVEAGDLNPLREWLFRLQLPSTEGMFAGTFGSVGVTDTISSAASGGGSAAVVAEPARRRLGALWFIPLAVIAALLAVLLTNCDDDETPAETIEAVDTTASAPETPTAPETSAATETSAAAPTSAPGGLPATVIDAAAEHGGFTTLAAAIEAAGLTDALSGAGPFTVFAPTDDAFSALPDGALDALLRPENRSALASVLQHHVVSGSVRSGDISPGEVSSLAGTPLVLALDGAKVTVDGATVTTPDIAAANGVVHEIDRVLLPPGFDLDAVLAAGAPPATDEIVVTDSSVPPTTTTAAATGDILATAGAAGTFTSLAAAIEAAGLTSTLQGPGPFTVFAPTDAAFAKVPVDVRDALLQPAGKAALTKILTYHVVPGTIRSGDLVAGDLATVEGQALKVAIAGSAVKVDDATVTSADVAATNGVIHVIDTVLLPPGLDLDALLAAAEPVSVGAPESLTVYFASGSAALDREARTKIVGAVTQLRGISGGTRVNIIGHADNTGDAAANQRLSLRRANAVLDAIRAGLGADASKIEFDVAAVGDTQPDADLAKSRRVTIEIRK